MQTTLNKSLTPFDSHTVLYQKLKSKLCLYLPTTFKLSINKITSIEPESRQAIVNATLFVKVYYGKVDPRIAVELSSKLRLSFDLNETIQMDENQHLNLVCDEDLANNELTWKMTNIQLKMSIVANTFLTPFQLLDLVLNVKLPPVEITNNIIIKFNLLDNIKNSNKISCKKSIKVADYNLAPALSKAVYSKNEISKVEEKEDLDDLFDNDNEPNQHEKLSAFLERTVSQNLTQIDQSSTSLYEPDLKTLFPASFNGFCYAHFSVSLYKETLGYILSNFGFLVILGLLTIGVYFQENSVSLRVSSIATIAIAFGTTFIAVRQSNRFKSGFTYTQYCIFFQMVACILPLIQTLRIQYISEYVFQCKDDNYFIATVIIEVIVIFSVIVLEVLHLTLWRPSYLKAKNGDQLQMAKVKKSLKETESNHMCELYVAAYNRVHKDSSKIVHFEGFNEEEKAFIKDLK